MKVKFTNPVTGKGVEFGRVINMLNDTTLVIETRGGLVVGVNPNSDYNFGFIPNEEADRKYAERLDRHIEELDALEKKSKKSC
jgi:hypothetical protein